MEKLWINIDSTTQIFYEKPTQFFIKKNTKDYSFISNVGVGDINLQNEEDIRLFGTYLSLQFDKIFSPWAISFLETEYKSLSNDNRTSFCLHDFYLFLSHDLRELYYPFCLLSQFRLQHRHASNSDVIWLGQGIDFCNNNDDDSILNIDTEITIKFTDNLPLFIDILKSIRGEIEENKNPIIEMFKAKLPLTPIDYAKAKHGVVSI